MSFSICLNSVSGIQVANLNNAIEYTFDFQNTPSHDGGYKLSFVYASNYFSNININRPLMYVNVNLDCDKMYKTNSQYTSTSPIRQLGVIRPSKKFSTLVSQQQAATVTNVSQIPINSNTTAYNRSSIITTPPTYDFQPVSKSADVRYKDNQSIMLTRKPTNNQLLVTITRNDGNLFSLYLIQPYTLILTFEAI